MAGRHAGVAMPVCDMDVRVGGHNTLGVAQRDRRLEMGMGGVYREVKAPERPRTTERFDEAWYPGESLNTLVLVEQGGRTTLTADDALRVGRGPRSRRSSPTWKRA